jgi:hypothetical protein
MVPSRQSRKANSPLKVVYTKDGKICYRPVLTPFEAYTVARSLFGKAFNIKIECPLRKPFDFTLSTGCAELTDWLYHGR